MNDSLFYYQISRSLYHFRKRTSQLLRSRTYALGNSIKIIAKEPVRFAGKSARLVITNPKKLYNLATGKQVLQRNKEIQDALTKEYQNWVVENELTKEEVENQRNATKRLKTKPLVSLITPVFNPPVDAHKKLVDSVLNQTYENFELLLYNFGDKAEVKELLNNFAKNDERIKVKHDLPNKGIGANSNHCLKDVKGEFVALLDHDDALTPNALYECIQALNKQNTDFIYTDKDKISEEDVRFEPLFKPDWSPEMALGGNYMTHFNLMRTEIVKKLGGWDPETDGAQDWDLFLRVIDESKKPVVHVPYIVYHWRTVKGSTANSIGVKPYAIRAQQRAVAKHFKRLGVNATPQHDKTGQMSIKWNKKPEPVLLVIHCINNDLQSVEGFLKKNYDDFARGTVVAIYYSNLDKSQKKHLQTIQGLSRNIHVKKYDEGSFVREMQIEAKKSTEKRVVYITDSVSDISNVSNESTWVDQLIGWLDLPGVEISSGGAFADTGQIIDIGSFFDPEIKNFVRYHSLSSIRSGYNGYIQWVRNFVLPASRPFAFNKTLLLETSKELLEVRDDEFHAMLCLRNYAKQDRAVYDPSVVAIDGAPFNIRLPMSSSLKSYTNTKCKDLLKGDPYYNKNLNNTYKDPKPLLKNDVRSINKEHYVAV